MNLTASPKVWIVSARRPDLDAELFFERHHQFHGVEAVGTQIVDERRAFGDLVLFDAQMLDDDLAHTIRNIAHVLSHMSPGRIPAHLPARLGWMPVSPPVKRTRPRYTPRGSLRLSHAHVMANAFRPCLSPRSSIAMPPLTCSVAPVT